MRAQTQVSNRNKFIWRSKQRAEQSAESVPDYKAINIKTKRGVIKPRTSRTSSTSPIFPDHDITFGVGPAGTGKTYLRVAAAVDAPERQRFAVFY